MENNNELSREEYKTKIEQRKKNERFAKDLKEKIQVKYKSEELKKKKEQIKNKEEEMNELEKRKSKLEEKLNLLENFSFFNRIGVGNENREPGDILKEKKIIENDKEKIKKEIEDIKWRLNLFITPEEREILKLEKTKKSLEEGYLKKEYDNRALEEYNQKKLLRKLNQESIDGKNTKDDIEPDFEKIRIKYEKERIKNIRITDKKMQILLEKTLEKDNKKNRKIKFIKGFVGAVGLSASLFLGARAIYKYNTVDKNNIRYDQIITDMMIHAHAGELDPKGHVLGANDAHNCVAPNDGHTYYSDRLEDAMQGQYSEAVIEETVDLFDPLVNTDDYEEVKEIKERLEDIKDSLYKNSEGLWDSKIVHKDKFKK